MGFSGSSIENEKIGNRVCLRCSVRSKSVSQVVLSTTKKIVYRVPLRRLSRLLRFSKKRKIGNRVFFQCSVCLKSVYHVVLSKNGKIVSRAPLGVFVALSCFLDNYHRKQENRESGLSPAFPGYAQPATDFWTGSGSLSKRRTYS